MKFSGLASALSGLFCIQSLAADSPLKVQFKDIASRLPFVSTSDFLYDREPHEFSQNVQIRDAWSQLLRVKTLAGETTEIDALTHDEDARVRTLALLSLISKETQLMIPAALRLTDDEAATFPEHKLVSNFSFESKVHTAPQTVAQIARRVLYMIDCKLAASPSFTEAEALEWWRPREGNPDWLAWHEFVYMRASQGRWPVPTERQAPVAQFMSKLNALPLKTKAWALLFLADPTFMQRGTWEDYFATEEEMITNVKSLGAEALLEFLRTGRRTGLRQPDLDDPDNGKRLILTYASHFFDEAQADTLINLKLFTAAMDANPKECRRYAELGVAAMSAGYFSWDRAKIMAALAAYGDRQDWETATRWFYDEINHSGGSTPQSVFISEVERRKPDHWRDIVIGIVAHPKFDLLRSADVMYVARLVDSLDGNAKLIGPGYKYEDKADQTRRQLWDMFNIAEKRESLLKLMTPGQFLQKPEWKLAFEEPAQSLAATDDGNLVAIAFEKENVPIRLVNSDGTLLTEIENSDYAIKLAFSDATGDLLIASGTRLRSWNAKGKRSMTERSPTQGKLFVGPRGNRQALVDQNRIEWSEPFNEAKLWAQSYPNRLFGHFHISPDAGLIAATDAWGRLIHLISTADGSYQTELSGHADEVTKLSFSHNSKRLVSAGEDNRLILWDVAARKALSRFFGESIRFGPAVMSSDGDTFWASPQRNQVSVHSVPNGEPRYGIKFEGSWISDLLPSTDGKRLYLLIRDNRSATPTRPARPSRLECWKLP